MNAVMKALAATAATVLIWGATPSAGVEPGASAGRAIVKADKVPVYAQAAASGERVATLKRGEVVTVDFALTTAEGAWCQVRAAGETRKAGYVRCDDLEREPPRGLREAPSRPSAPGAAPQAEALPVPGEASRAILEAALKGDIPTLRALLEQGADQGTKDAALRTAVVRGRTDAAKLLLAAGADVHHKDNNGQTCLYLAANSGDFATVQALLAAGADPNSRKIWDGTPLMAAA